MKCKITANGEFMMLLNEMQNRKMWEEFTHGHLDQPDVFINKVRLK